MQKLFPGIFYLHVLELISVGYRVHFHDLGVIVDQFIDFADFYVTAGNGVYHGAGEIDGFAGCVPGAGEVHHAGAHIVDPGSYELFFGVVISEVADAFEGGAHKIPCIFCLEVAAAEDHCVGGFADGFHGSCARLHPHGDVSFPGTDGFGQHLVDLAGSGISHHGFHVGVALGSGGEGTADNDSG